MPRFSDHPEKSPHDQTFSVIYRRQKALSEQATIFWELFWESWHPTSVSKLMRRLALAHSSKLIAGPRLRTESQLYSQNTEVSWQIYSTSGCLISTPILTVAHRISGKIECDASHREKAATIRWTGRMSAVQCLIFTPLSLSTMTRVGCSETVWIWALSTPRRLGQKEISELTPSLYGWVGWEPQNTWICLWPQKTQIMLW